MKKLMGGGVTYHPSLRHVKLLYPRMPASAGLLINCHIQILKERWNFMSIFYEEKGPLFQSFLVKWPLLASKRPSHKSRKKGKGHLPSAKHSLLLDS